MSGRPVLKLTFSKPRVEQQPARPPTPPPAPTPTSSLPKLKLKIGAKPPAQATPTPAPSKPTKKPKTSRPKDAQPTPRATSSKKRPRDDAGIDKTATGATNKPAPGAVSAVKRIKFSTKPPPSIRLRSKGEPPVRPKGVGYDSEASDTEIDPALEEEFILRMQPGEDCDYLRQAVAENRFGPRSQGGADVSFKSLTRDGRRAIVTIRGHIYAASLVDLPCIIEAMKSWDKRGWYKSADICQMLLVLGRVSSEEEARTYPLPKDVDETTFQFAHGITPPLRWVRKRRFRKRISNRTIEAVELEVARLMQEDMAAVDPPEFEVLDYAQHMRGTSALSEEPGRYMGEGEYDDEQDAEGEVDEYYPQPSGQDEGGDDFEDELAAEMEAALAAHAEGDEEPASAAMDTQMPDATQTTETEVDGEGELEAGTPMTKPGETSGDEDDESDGSSGDDADADADLDEDALEQQRQLQEQREEIAEIEAEIEAEMWKWERLINPILKMKVGRRVQSLKQALRLKKVAIGEGEDE